MTTPCPHLEALISDKPQDSLPTFESTHRRVAKDVERIIFQPSNVIIPDRIKNGYYEKQFRRKLTRAGLSVIVTDILCLRFVFDCSFREISEELKIVSVTRAYELYNEAIAHLKQKGWKVG